MTISMAEEVGDTISVGNNRIYSDGGSREDEHGNDKALVARGRVSIRKPIYHGYGQKDEWKLLCLWGFWSYSKEL